MAASKTVPPTDSVRVDPDQPVTTPDRAPLATPASASFGRLTWMLLGPFALVLSTFVIFKEKSWFGVGDIAYFGVLGAMLLGRWAEFRGGQAHTADGEPATKAHLRR